MAIKPEFNTFYFVNSSFNEKGKISKCTAAVFALTTVLSYAKGKTHKKYVFFVVELLRSW